MEAAAGQGFAQRGSKRLDLGHKVAGAEDGILRWWLDVEVRCSCSGMMRNLIDVWVASAGNDLWSQGMSGGPSYMAREGCWRD